VLHNCFAVLQELLPPMEAAKKNVLVQVNQLKRAAAQVAAGFAPTIQATQAMLNDSETQHNKVRTVHCICLTS
jgi:hypothetical protein